MNLQVIHALSRRVVAVTLLGATLALGACAMTGTAPATISSGVFTNGAGMTLYTFDKDTAGSGKSVCNGPCAQLWPPLIAPADAKPSGEWTVVTRDDGAKQWAYRGKPIYAYSKDTAAGERKGDGFNQLWSLAKP